MSNQTSASAAGWPLVDAIERGKKIRRRRAKFGVSSVSEFSRMTKERGRYASVDAITAAEKGEASENTYVKLETFLDELEEEAGYEEGELLSAAEAELAAPPDEPDVMEFDIQGPTSKWHVHAKASKGNADEAIAALAKLIGLLPQEPGNDDAG